MACMGVCITGLHRGLNFRAFAIQCLLEFLSDIFKELSCFMHVGDAHPVGHRIAEEDVGVEMQGISRFWFV